ncbi:hypothetical protein JG665_08580 [Vibrio cholerae]|uniref:hypothetical protein n=2 Tax=Vibrio cholerae TaxID=666 RepID=UPI00163D0B99|nr:hypothetical protein [Vibrio cholerae]MBJ6865322.1 hypothetical protein [Vibrio cholerae]MBJ6868868.1 hypothetical protein [Vibrio cholerae]MBJ6872493.1 hypothetical protein [Vibrio cholerae]MBJ6876062.1 hypothetical protein [Vibrio cholerae]HBC3995714.1 hypothetical protein [Vibrio cholerae]
MALITEAQLNMANLNEEPVWEEGIYQFETTDPVEGGPEGIDNKPTRQLANRTAYLKEEQGKIKEEVLLLNQQWSENANYGIGHEVVRNGLRYIARLASGPDNGGAITPGVTEGKWDLVLPQAYTLRNPTQWVKIAVVAGGTATDGDAVSISVYGGSNYASAARFSADILLGERGDSVSAVIEPKTLALNNPTFYTKRIAPFTYELWFKRETSFPSVLTIVQKSRPLVSVTKVGILETSSTAPTDTTLVPYDTGYQFASIPIGMEVAFDTPPPTNDPRFRFVKLTYNDAYNTGLLTSQTLSGSAPELVSTAVISAAQSPINGQTIDMINTMGTFIRPGVTAGVRKSSQNKAHTHSEYGAGQAEQVGGGGIAVLRFATGNTGVSGGDEANPYCLSRVFYKRIY